MTRHSIHCAGYRGVGKPFDEAACDCGGYIPEAFTCLESNRDILSIVYDPTGNAMTHGDIVDTLNALQAEVYQLRADVGGGDTAIRALEQVERPLDAKTVAKKKRMVRG